jgi:hypothetical protein
MWSNENFVKDNINAILRRFLNICKVDQQEKLEKLLGPSSGTQFHRHLG